METIITKRGGLRMGLFELLQTGVRFHGKPGLDDFIEVATFVQFCEAGSPWWWGDLLRYAETREDWGERWTQALESSGKSEETLRKGKFVSENVASVRRRTDVSYSVHSEAASLKPVEQTRFLARAAKEGWTRREARLNLRLFKRSKAEPSDVVDGLFRVVYADPPWRYGDSGVVTTSDAYGKAERHYPTMAIDELVAFKIGDKQVSDLVGDDAVLFLWVTSPLLNECWPVIEAWGFDYKTSIVWDKVAHNFGHYVSVRHEMLLLCTRGSCLPDRPTPMPDSVQTIKRTEIHSEKPEEFRALIEKLYDGPYVELFARRKVKGWTGHGNHGPRRIMEADVA